MSTGRTPVSNTTSQVRGFMDVLGTPSESAKTSSSSVTVFTPGSLPEEEEKVPLIEPL